MIKVSIQGARHEDSGMFFPTTLCLASRQRHFIACLETKARIIMGTCKPDQGKARMQKNATRQDKGCWKLCLEAPRGQDNVSRTTSLIFVVLNRLGLQSLSWLAESTPRLVLANFNYNNKFSLVQKWASHRNPMERLLGELCVHGLSSLIWPFKTEVNDIR